MSLPDPLSLGAVPPGGLTLPTFLCRPALLGGGGYGCHLNRTPGPPGFGSAHGSRGPRRSRGSQPPPPPVLGAAPAVPCAPPLPLRALLPLPLPQPPWPLVLPSVVPLGGGMFSCVGFWAASQPPFAIEHAGKESSVRKESKPMGKDHNVGKENRIDDTVGTRFEGGAGEQCGGIERRRG